MQCMQPVSAGSLQSVWTCGCPGSLAACAQAPRGCHWGTRQRQTVLQVKHTWLMLTAYDLGCDVRIVGTRPEVLQSQILCFSTSLSHQARLVMSEAAA